VVRAAEESVDEVAERGSAPAPVAPALALAQANGVALFAIQSAHTAYEFAVTAGFSRQDYAALATL
jgi:hypothetical protein